VIPRYVRAMTFTDKYLRAPGPVEMAGRQVKRYHVSTLAPPRPDLARYLADMLPDGTTAVAA
jgi:hypothetical protein